ncbi:hypothetical protein [Pseudomonas sp. RP23018S]|uniref:hypothetical protein n=1 Tax=Pseudomonas sp. RP23018S TaxID=3096037 RepID=UPI002ACBF301|nr:hypothetical protein [Pseudomonas sp. RP23018S]
MNKAPRSTPVGKGAASPRSNSADVMTALPTVGKRRFWLSSPCWVDVSRRFAQRRGRLGQLRIVRHRKRAPLEHFAHCAQVRGMAQRAQRNAFDSVISQAPLLHSSKVENTADFF